MRRSVAEPFVERDYTYRGHTRADVLIEQEVDARGLEAELRRRVRGEVRFDDGSRGLYATDASNYRQVPIGVVLPRDAEDVEAAVAVAREFGAPILPRGGGTSLAGQCTNVAVVLDFSKYLRAILEIDAEGRRARVQPGCVLDDLRRATAPHGLTFGPDPATHEWCCIGGMIGNNSCGVHSVEARLYGPGSRTSDNLESLEVLTYDGERLRVGATSEAELETILRAGGRRAEIYRRLRELRDRYADEIHTRYPKIPRRVSGYNLDDLLPERGFHVARALAGTEGTCVLVLEATLRLIESPPHRVLLVLGYPDIFAAGDHVPEVLTHGPTAVEGVDCTLVENNLRLNLYPRKVRLLPEGNGWLLVEFGGSTAREALERARAAAEALRRSGRPVSARIFETPKEKADLWEVRESGLAATARVPGEPDTWEGWEDSAVAPERLGDYLRELRALLERFGYDCALYGHFGDGCVHTRIDFRLQTAEGIRRYRDFMEAATDLVVRYGGSFSGEHGDGQSRAEFLPKLFGPDLVEAFREFKRIWDPEGRMNPRKVVDPYRIDENLRLGTDYRPPQPETLFRYPEDRGSFARAALRCVGVGKCRKTHRGVMCPSYMVTLEEKHTTRGRAHLLFEMLEGDAVTGGWQDESVKESLDLCLSCKGCKGDCPMRVDLAAYKAEFLAHYYRKRRRPAAAYLFGWIDRWARVASLAPGLANRLAEAPLLSDLAKAALGIAPARRFPAFAPETFRAWFRRRGPGRTAGRPVLLWVDTFTNHFTPEVGRAAVEVLEAAGYRIELPEPALCCGRPLYDYGLLETARERIRRILAALRPQIEAGVPLVGLEPSCVSVFRDEALAFFPEDADAKRLQSQAFLLTEFLVREGWEPPRLHGRALVHGHCHHRSVLSRDLEDERTLLGRLGLEAEVLDSGCCGMAGGFGFERGERYAVSVACGERVLLPAVRAASPETLLIADGFSCREQIWQETGRRALHIAEVLRQALGGEEPSAGTAPAVTARRLSAEARAGAALLLAGGACLAGALWLADRRARARRAGAE